MRIIHFYKKKHGVRYASVGTTGWMGNVKPIQVTPKAFVYTHSRCMYSGSSLAETENRCTYESSSYKHDSQAQQRETLDLVIIINKSSNAMTHIVHFKATDKILLS